MLTDPIPVSLGLRSNPARNRQASYCQLTNCFAEEQGEDGRVTWILYGTEGLTVFGTALAGGGIRAMIVVGSTLYAVAGRNIYAVTTGGAASLIGGIPTDGPVYMERNRRVPAQIGIVSDGLYYVIDTGTNSVTEILDPDLPAPISISVLDGYGVIPVINGSYFLTGIDDFTTIDGLDEGTCEAYPDEIVRSVVLEREVVFFGETSIEWHQNTGDADFPFTRVHALELGCLAGDSVTKVDTPSVKTIIWVCPDHTVRRMNGYAGQVISTPEIEKLIAALHKEDRASELKGIAWAHEGRFFYALTCDDWTRVYDSKTGHWHNRQSYELDRWRISAVIPFGPKVIAGDYSTGQLYVMDSNTFDEDGNYLVWEVITPNVHAFPYPLKFSALFMDAATGVGLNSTNAHESDPKLMVSWSDDGGYSWSAERERSLGTTAEYRRIKPIYRMGRERGKGRNYRFRISAPVERVMLQIALSSQKLSA